MPSILSNISDDPFERQEYLRAVERCERCPKTHQIILDPDISPRWWTAMINAERLDPAFRNHILLVAEKYKHYLAAPAPREASKKSFRADPYPVSSEPAGKLIQQAMATPGFDHSLPPLRFKSGRGGRVQIRFVAELPHEISAKDRALIVQNFYDKLASLKDRVNPDRTIEKIGMMHTAVIPAPDAHNDSRNYHLHIVAHDCPAEFLEAQGMWDFEVQEHYIDFRKERIRYPFRQNKIGEVSQGTNNTAKMNSGRDFVPAMRGEFAKITNAVLKSRGISRRYDQCSYEAIGIDRTPTEHLGTKAATFEAIGVPTVVGQLNAIAIWNDAERAIVRHAKHSEKELKERQKDIEALARKLSYYDTNHPTLITLRQLIAQRSQMIETLAEDRRAIMTFDHLEAKAKSRAIRTRQTCLQYLADIEYGKADGSTRIMKSVITARWKDAQTHIENIDEQLRPHRDELSQMAADIERREKVVEILDKAYSDLEAEVLSYIDERNRIAQDYRYDLTHNREAPPTINAQSPAPVPAPATGQSIALGDDAKTGSEPEPKSEPIAVEPTTASDAKTGTPSSEPTPPEQMTNNALPHASNQQTSPTNRIEGGTETQLGPKPQAVERSEEKPAAVAGQLRASAMDALPIETSVGPAPLQATNQSPAPVTSEQLPALEDAQNSGSKPELKFEPMAAEPRTASKAETGRPSSELTHPTKGANKALQGASNRQITPTERIEGASETQPTPKPQSVETSEQVNSP